MKSKYIAAASLAICARTAFAQSNATLYGGVGTGLWYDVFVVRRRSAANGAPRIGTRYPAGLRLVAQIPFLARIRHEVRHHQR